ncbi:hypothetical protein MMC29_003106 [Sticta canariensis]|nr:hypothetical protein [Sticta canariensis]
MKRKPTILKFHSLLKLQTSLLSLLEEASAELLSDDRVHRLVKAIEQGRAICFVPGLNDATQEIFISRLTQHSLEFTKEVEQRTLAVPEPLTQENLAIVESSSVEGNPESRGKKWLSGKTTTWVESRSLSHQRFGGPSDTSFGRAMFFDALTDIPNPRSSGYLEHSRFAQSFKIASESKILTDDSSSNEGLWSRLRKLGPKFIFCSQAIASRAYAWRSNLRSITRPFELARMNLKGCVVTEKSSLRRSDKENERNLAASFEQNHIRFHSHGAINSLSSLEMLASRATSSLGVSSPRSEATAYFTAETSAESGAEKDTTRALCFADTLAKLEDRVPPSSSSPLQHHDACNYTK